MKDLKTLTLKSVVAVTAAATFGLTATAAQADNGAWQFLRELLTRNWDWSTAVAESALNTTAAEGCPIETADGLSLLFASTRPNGVPGSTGNDIWVADRDAVTAPWQAPKNLGAPINSTSNDFCPTPVYGRSLFFVSERPGDGTGPAPCGGGDMYLSRQSPSGSWSKPVMLQCAPAGPNFVGGERSPSLVESRFGTYLFYSSTGNGSTQDIYASRMGADGEFGPGRLITSLSLPGFDDLMPNVREREDGQFEIVFSSNRTSWGRGYAPFGGQDVYSATAWTLPDGWSDPRNLGIAVNTVGNEQRATLSSDGLRLHFGRDGDLFTSERGQPRR